MHRRKNQIELRAGRSPTFARNSIRSVNIFFREVQTVWEELYPYADKKALTAAKRLGQPSTAEGLAKLVPHKDLPRLLSALVRTDLAKDGYDAVKERASQRKAA